MRTFRDSGERLAVDSAANVMGCMQRVRRFLSSVGISPAMTVLPLIRLMRPLLSNLPEIVLAIDRTVLGRSAKSYISILPSVGYIEGLQQMEWLSGIPIHVVADREFASPKLAEWLKSTYGVDATLRMKASMYLKGMDDEMPEVKIATLLLGNC